MAEPLPPDDSRVWKVLLGSIVSVVLATFAVLARLVARRISAVPLWWDDWTITASLAVQWGMGISRWIPVDQWYYGHHTVYVGQQNLRAFQKAFVGIQTLYFLNAVLTKLSLLFLFDRLFGVVTKFKIALWVSAGIVIAYWIPCTILAFLGCTPFERNWDKSIPGTCVDLVNFFRWNGICNLIIDFLILTLPLPMVWRLNIPARQKLELTGIFTLGLFVCITSIMRVLAYKPTQLRDSTWSGVDSMTWSIVEQGIGIVCACLPTLRPLLVSCSGSRGKNPTEESRSSGMGMDNIRSGNYEDKGAVGKSVWRATPDSESTVGFARLRDDDGALTPADIQRSVYAPLGAVISTSAENGDKTQAVPSGIVKETNIDQRSDPA